MKQAFFVHDLRGERAVHEADFPLTIGGAEVADIVLPDWPAEAIAAYVAQSEGHFYVQPKDMDMPIFHNHERLGESVWLKSGDQVELGTAVVHWLVRGDQVFINVVERGSIDQTRLVPPAAPLRASLPDNRVAAAPTGAHRRRFVRPLIIGALGILMVLALFLLSATPVVIRIVPEPDELSLTGFPPPLSVGGRHLVLPGRYALQANRRGYYPLQESLDVGDEGFREFAFALRPLPGRVSVRVDPEVGFRLSVDGNEQQPNDQGLFEIAPGQHRLRVTADRYLPEDREVEIVGLGREQRITYELRPAWADVQIASDPIGAQVQVDGVVVGVTPLQVEILEGLRELRFALPKHKTMTVRQQFKAGEALTMDKVLLPPADGELAISTQPTEATVSVDGDYRGRTPVKLAIAANVESRIRIIKAGYGVVDRLVTLAPEEARSLEITLTPEYGTIFLSTQPADAQLFVNGKARGSATRRLRLTARPHVLEIRKAGYANHRVQVTPRPGVSRTVRVQLRRVGQAATGKSPGQTLETVPARVTSPNGDELALIRPGGPFIMGASRREPGRRANESRRKVALTRPYYLGIKEVTNAQFRRFRSAHRSGTEDGIGLDDDSQPVVKLSWEEAARYCNWLSNQQGLPPAYINNGGKLELAMPPNTGYRLPTEAEWAYAARIHKRAEPARYPWAGRFPPTVVTGNYADARVADILADVVPGYDDGYPGTAPVGSFDASPGGFYDLGGNVAEWTNDYYSVYPSNVDAPQSDPRGPTSGEHRVVRGASWRHGNITELRLSYRDYSKQPRSDLGFRIARFAR